MRRLALISLYLLGCHRAPAPGREPADLIFQGGTILTMDPLRPTASAVAVRGQHIVAVGEAIDVKPYLGAHTRIVDLAGGTLLPGLVDAHAHLYTLGRSLEELDLTGTASQQAVADKVAAAAQGRKPGEWIVGNGWDQSLWTPGELPADHAMLDRAAPANPVILWRVDGHAAWVNSAVLTAAHLPASHPGLLLDNDASAVNQLVPPDPPEVRERRIAKGAELAVARGLTGVHEMGVDAVTAGVYRKLASEGRLPLRVYAFWRGVDSMAGHQPEVDRDGTAMFVVRGVKLFADGALGSRGARLLAPYSDAVDSQGNWISSPETLATQARQVADAGFQLGVHAIGDAAVRATLDAMAPFAGQDRRFRVEHAQVVSRDDQARFGQLGVIASMQPVHATSDMRWAEARLGPERVLGAYAWHSLLGAGAHVCFGSDFPFDQLPPLAGIHAAVTRQDAQGWPQDGFVPGERLSLLQALRAYTVEPAYASFVEGRRGVIAVGAVADLTWLDRELRPDRSLLEVRVRGTFVGGRVVYDGH